MRIIACLWAFVLCGAIGLSGWRWHDSAQHERDARTRLASTTAQIERLRMLRDSGDRVSIAPRPEGDVVTRVSAALASAGLPISRLQSVDPQPDTAVRGEQNRLREQVQRITFDPIGLSEFGGWLEAWRDQSGPWTIAGVDISRRPRAQDADADAYRLSLTLSAVYIPDGVGEEE